MFERMTWKQKCFCRNYVNNGHNGTQAAIEAGYSKDTAAVIASENLTKPYVVKYMEELQRQKDVKMEMTIEWKLEKLKRCIEASITDEDGPQALKNHQALLGAISESNKMQGHYAKEKESEDSKAQEAVDLLNELIKQNKKEF